MRFDFQGEREATLRLPRRYAGAPMSFADACLVRLCDRHPESRLFTRDLDFTLYRRTVASALRCSRLGRGAEPGPSGLLRGWRSDFSIGYNRAVADLALQTLIEFRAEVREFRDETRKGLAQHDHRLNVLTEQARANTEALRALIQQMRDQSARLAQLETHMAALLATMPHVHTRIDDLAARVAALEAKLAASH